MGGWFESVTDLEEGAAAIRQRAYGIIEIRESRLVRIVFRPWPKLFTGDDVSIRGLFAPKRLQKDACRLYYNQPASQPNYLALKYIVSSWGTRFGTIRRAMLVLDEVARIKQSDAIVSHVASESISDRLMERWGWERHLAQSRRRHFIKRFYGKYPPKQVLDCNTLNRSNL